MQVKYKILTLYILLLSITLQAQQLLEETLTHDGETREYTIYIPENYDENNPIPLLFNFHGGSGDIASQIAISDMRSMADTEGFIIVYPQALPDPNDGGSTQWTHKAPTEVDDIYFVEAMIDGIAAEYSIDQNRVYACGYSNGGEFTLELACRLSERIAAIGVVARSMFIDTYNTCAPTHPTAVLTIHGTNDDYEGIEWFGTLYYISLDELNSYWSGYNNTNATPIITELPNSDTSDGSTVERHAWTEGDGCVSVEHLKVIDGGHDWPGTFGNMDISADVEIWDFVSKYDLGGLIDCGTTALKEGLKANDIQVYPNPVTDFIWINNLTKDQRYSILSTDGKILLEGSLHFDENVIDVSLLSADVYFLKVGDDVVKLVKLD